MLEQQIENLTTAIGNLILKIDTLNKSASVPADVSATDEGTVVQIGAKRSAGRPPKAKIDKETCTAALVKLKDKFGVEHARTLVKKFGGVEKMADIPGDKLADVYAAAIAKYDELMNGEAASADDGGI